MAVTVLGLEIALAASSADMERVDLVCMGVGGVHVLIGQPVRACPTAPALVEWLSPVASVHIKRAQGAIYNGDITPLSPDGSSSL